MKKHLRDVIGQRAYKALCCGCLLQIWRGSTPHNWFIETKRGDMLWHSDPGWPRPSLKLFDKVYDSESTIVRYWGADAGHPELTHYKLKSGG